MNGLNQYTTISGSGALPEPGPSSAVSFTYDPLGRLASSTPTGGETSNFLYSGSMLVGEYQSGSIPRVRPAAGPRACAGRYIPGPDPDEALLWYYGSGEEPPSGWLRTLWDRPSPIPAPRARRS
ncbi:MAG: hypothetical protein ACREEX_00035 [Caulobacteraceae bacterium]